MENFYCLVKILLFAQVFKFSYCDIVENYYCGDSNCYELLQVSREATKLEVKRAFRLVAGKTHPDKFQDPEEKREAEQRFLQIQTAYDILRDKDARADYDYMLDNPDEFYMNYYRAWRRRNAPNVDVRIVIAVVISLISLVQYYSGWVNYEEAIQHFTTLPKYRFQATELAKQEGIFPEEKKSRQMTKAKVKEEQEKAIRTIIECKMDIKGCYAKPTYKDILWVQLALAPFWSAQYCVWFARWVWKFWILHEPFEDGEKLYLIRKNLAMSQFNFDNIPEATLQVYLQKELWKKNKFKVWKEQKDYELRCKLNQSAKYRAYKRYLKHNGPSRIYFED